MVGSWLRTKVGVTDSGEHSSLLRCGKNVSVKSFIAQAPVTYAHMEMNPALQIKKKSGRKFKKTFLRTSYHHSDIFKVAGNKDISEIKSKQQSPCSNCMHRHVTSWGNAFSTCMHKPVKSMHRPVMSQANAWTYWMGSKVSSLSPIYLYSSYFVTFSRLNQRHLSIYLDREWWQPR